MLWGVFAEVFWQRVITDEWWHPELAVLGGNLCARRCENLPWIVWHISDSVISITHGLLMFYTIIGGWKATDSSQCADLSRLKSLFAVDFWLLQHPGHFVLQRIRCQCWVSRCLWWWNINDDIITAPQLWNVVKVSCKHRTVAVLASNRNSAGLILISTGFMHWDHDVCEEFRAFHTRYCIVSFFKVGMHCIKILADTDTRRWLFSCYGWGEKR